MVDVKTGLCTGSIALCVVNFWGSSFVFTKCTWQWNVIS